MMRIGTVAVGLMVALVLLMSSPAAAQCTKDTDCKGERVCANGQCVSPGMGAPAPTTVVPPAAPGYPPAGYPPAGYAPAPAQPPMGAYGAAPAGPLTWFSGYAMISTLLTFHSWGEISPSDFDASYDLDGNFWGGVDLRGYFATSPGFHIGGFFSYSAGEGELEGAGTGDVWNSNVGLAMKFGGRVGNRVWLGGAVDFGGFFLNVDDLDETFYGVVLSPKFVLDILAVDQGGFKLGFNAGLGPMIIPYYTGEAEGTDVDGWVVGVQMMFGVILGG